MNDRVKIGSVILLSTVIGVVLFLALFIDNSKKDEIKFIELTGNYHLSSNAYLRFANLDIQDNYVTLSTKIVKDRLEKHPYVKSVDLLLTENTLHITIFEKKFESLLMTKDKEYLISDKSVIIPKLSNSDNIDYPIINSPKNAKSIKEFSNIRCNKDLILGLKIISAIKIINSKLYESLSEVNLRDGNDIVIQFSNLDIPIVIGRDREIEKIVIFEKLIKKLDFNKIENSLTYIDLRYNKYIYVGNSNSNVSEEESSI